MAIQKDYELDNGITVSYHVLDYNLHKSMGFIQAHVQSYIDKMARDNGKKPVLESYSGIIPAAIWITAYSNSGNVSETIYDWLIKNVDIFKNGTKV